MAPAEARGATFVHAQALKPLYDEDRTVHTLRIKTPDGQGEEVEAKVLIDASAIEYSASLGRNVKVCSEGEELCKIFSWNP